MPDNRNQIVTVDNRGKIVRAMRWIVYPLAVIGITLFALDWRSGDTGAPRLSAFISGLDSVSDVIIFVLVLVFSLAMIGLAIEFVISLVGGAVARGGYGQSLLKIGQPPLAGRIVMPLLVSLFVAGVNVLAFKREWTSIDASQLSPAEIMLFWFFYGLAHFLLVVSVVRIFAPGETTEITDKGFVYAPSGLSQGLVLWSDVAGLKEMEMVFGGQIVSVKNELVLVVTLKQPEKYAVRINPLLRLFLGASRAITRFQAGEGDIVMPAFDFGREYQTARDLMVRLVTEAGGRTELL